MRFDFNNFTIYTTKHTEQLKEQYFAPTSIKNGRPSDYQKFQKTRELNCFASLLLHDKIVLNDLFELIDLVEILKAYSNKKLFFKEEYNFSHFAAKIVTRDSVPHLKIAFSNNPDRILYLDIFECISLSSKFQKVLSKCEAFSFSED